ncbi:Lumazine synthase [Morchella conica CCBAS932]|uniref:6,7-dimethyl-8-ribityllumazine synthase n=1 Tax=Morchella conica CCBAS932 TaxID=1392247 RepID=A0A3N4KUR4_9PEZI|nr:Lumazine synthase [Morchella conica CCBAS932]
MFSGTKGPGEVEALDGTNLRVLIVHARWNPTLITPLVEGAKKKLLERGVKPLNIITQSVPGPFDAIIPIGVLIKGDTVHFEHIAESVSRGLMRLQLDFGVPVIFGLLTVLNEDQAKKRAGLTADGHNHGEDWGEAAVEMGAKRKLWADGIIG